MDNPLNQEQTERLVNIINDTYNSYKELNATRQNELLEVYEAFRKYKETKKQDWETSFVVNKAHETVERVVPRIVAKNPRWIVLPAKDDFYDVDNPLPNDISQEEREQLMLERHQQTIDYSNAVQDYLNYVFDEYQLYKKLRRWAKNMVVYGKGYAKVVFKYERDRVMNNGVIEEVVVGEHPDIDIKSFSEILTDPNYIDVSDLPAYIELKYKIRLNALKRNDKYFNLDKVKELAEASKGGGDISEKIQAITGIKGYKGGKIDANALNLVMYYGYFDENDDGNEKLVKAVIVKDTGLLIGYEEILRFPFVEISAFEDTETNFAVGFVEPIIGLQDELNFKKNSASEYINQALHRSWVWSPNSGIDPRDLQSKPGNIITTTTDVPTAMANLQEIPHRNLPVDYFHEQNDIERQIQGQTFMIDTNNSKNPQGLTNTATGMRIKFFESNSVIAEITKHFEEGVQELAYKLLQETFDNVEDNIVFPKMGNEGYWEIHKEVLRDAVKRYRITVEVNSSSFDDNAERRNDALGLFNILLQAKQAGENVNLRAAVMDILDTFERRTKNEYIQPPNMVEVAQQQQQLKNISKLPYKQDNQDEAAAITEQVAQGNITQGI